MEDLFIEGYALVVISSIVTQGMEPQLGEVLFFHLLNVTADYKRTNIP
jgi:hypothetical protein